jgi:hypothetical protein
MESCTCFLPPPSWLARNRPHTIEAPKGGVGEGASVRILGGSSLPPPVCGRRRGLVLGIGVRITGNRSVARDWAGVASCGQNFSPSLRGHHGTSPQRGRTSTWRNTWYDDPCPVRLRPLYV